MSFRLYIGLTTGRILGLEPTPVGVGLSWRVYIRVTTGGILGLELAAIHRDDDWRDTGAGAGGYT